MRGGLTDAVRRLGADRFTAVDPKDARNDDEWNLLDDASFSWLLDKAPTLFWLSFEIKSRNLNYIQMEAGAKW